MNENSLIHRGHRQRMREKLGQHGARIFDTYELLEMLLYQVIPYKDTNPIAKKLLSRFGSLSGVLRADAEQLCEVEGIGRRAAELIILAGRYGSLLDGCENDGVPVFDDSTVAGRYFVDYFGGSTDRSVAVFLLDNGMRLIDSITIDCQSFGSAAVKPRIFIDAVTRTGAGNVLIACHHKYSALFFTDSEIATYKSVKAALSDIHVTLVAGYVVSGKHYSNYDFDCGFSFFTPSPEREKFVSSMREGVFSVE